MRLAFLALGFVGCTLGVDRSSPSLASLQPCQVAGVAETARCGSVRVRESADSDRTIDLRVVVVPALTSAPLSDPIVALVGGPGQGAAELASALASRYAGFRDRRDLVFIDQRGTGGSNGLGCPAPTTTRERMGRIFDVERLASCRSDLARRADLTKYTTTAAADDYPLAFDQLGYQTVNLIGISYGSRMGLEIARRHPTRARTLTIEGIVPTNFDWPTHGATDAESALNTLIDDCAADRACASAYPRFLQDVEAAFARVRGASVTATVRDPLTGAIERVPFGVTDLAYATRGILYGADALSLPLWFSRAASGDFDAFAQAYVTRARALDAEIARGVHLGVYCTEDLPFVDFSAATRAASNTRMGTYLLDQYRDACSGWPRSTLAASFREPVQSAIPALVMAGRRDPVTPPRTAVEVSRTLTRSKLVVWPYGGHGTDGLISSDCRARIMGTFVATADPSAIDDGCASRDTPRPFVSGVN
jgi:pimeloyl-ACP methyl ester carboxylesterase